MTRQGLNWNFAFQVTRETDPSPAVPGGAGSLSADQGLAGFCLPRLLPRCDQRQDSHGGDYQKAGGHHGLFQDELLAAVCGACV